MSLFWRSDIRTVFLKSLGRVSLAALSGRVVVSGRSGQVRQVRWAGVKFGSYSFVIVSSRLSRSRASVVIAARARSSAPPPPASEP